MRGAVAFTYRKEKARMGRVAEKGRRAWEAVPRFPIPREDPFKKPPAKREKTRKKGRNRILDDERVTRGKRKPGGNDENRRTTSDERLPD